MNEDVTFGSFFFFFCFVTDLSETMNMTTTMEVKFTWNSMKFADFHYCASIYHSFYLGHGKSLPNR